MKKIILILMMLTTSIFANAKLDFMISVRKKGCEMIKWTENTEDWKYFAEVSCKDPLSMPANIVGLKFLDVNIVNGKYIYRYGAK